MTPRKILALTFELEAESDNAWLDEHGNGKYLLPAHPDHCLLDVRAGDRVTFKRKQVLTVRGIKPFRTSECKDETQYGPITCGRDWEAGE